MSMERNMISEKRKRIVRLLFVCLVFLSFDIGYVYAQDAVTAQGQVLDKATNEPVIGASVVEKGTRNGAITDLNGNFTLKVGQGAVITFSSIGYLTVEQAVKAGHMTIYFEEDAKTLDEVVVVGYGVQKKINLTGAVATVNASRLESRATSNLSTSLAGFASGVSVRQGSGDPRDDGANIRIRGIGTFSGDYRSPLVVIDGAVADINSVNSEDVESVSFLKDAASAAIYGSRAANGVILVTTKKGVKGSAPKVTYTGIFTQEKASSSFDLMSDYADYMELYNKGQLVANPNATVTYAQADIDAWRAAKANPNGIYTDPDTGNQSPNWLAYPNTDWSAILFAPNYTQKHNLSVSGSSENSNYLLSLGYYDNPGTLENTGVDRFNMRVNAETRITHFLKIGTQTYLTQQRAKPGDLENVKTYRFQSVSGMTPYYDGKYGGVENPGEKPDTKNLLKDINSVGGLTTTTRLNTTWFADLDLSALAKGLTARGSINYQNYFKDAKTYSRSLDRYSFRTGKIIDQGTALTSATTRREADRNRQYTATATANYITTIAKDHDLTALAGYEQFYYNTSGFDATKLGLLDFSVTDITSASEMYSIGGDKERDYAMVSYFGRINYGYKGRYLFEANLRRDASSRFAPDNRWGTFPSFSAGWRISEESFFEPARKYVDNLKLRASWGQLGNTTSGYYDWQATYGKVNNVLGGKIYNGLATTKIANTLLQWEQVTSKGIGLDASFLGARLNVELDLYERLTEGILTTPGIYLTMGLDEVIKDIKKAPTKNTSDMRNRGLEITIGWNDKIGNVRYSISGNFAYNHNTVAKYKGKMEEKWVTDSDGKRTYVSNIGDVSDTGSETGTLRVEGHRFDEYYLRTYYKGTGTYTKDGVVDPNGGPKDGMIRTEADLQWVRDMLAFVDPVTGTKPYTFNGLSVNQASGLWLGEYILADLNGDGNYGNSYDRRFTGKSAAPKYGYGLTASAEWKGIDFSMTWAGQAGFHYYLHERGVNRNYITSQTDALPADARQKFWSEENPTAEYARLRVGGAGAYMVNDQFLYDASFLKLKTVQIGYSFPKALLQKASIDGLRLFVTGENLLTITSYPGVDPELGAGVNVYPIARLLSVGVNLSF